MKNKYRKGIYILTDGGRLVLGISPQASFPGMCHQKSVSPSRVPRSCRDIWKARPLKCGGGLHVVSVSLAGLAT